jgi:hypothetical protein
MEMHSYPHWTQESGALSGRLLLLMLTVRLLLTIRLIDADNSLDFDADNSLDFDADNSLDLVADNSPQLPVIDSDHHAHHQACTSTSIEIEGEARHTIRSKWGYQAFANDHTTANAPVLVRSPKLSAVGLG